MDKKSAKHFMVNNTQILLERDRLIMNENDEMIKRQMTNYQVVKQTVKGEPIYSSEDEHALDCLMLCVLGYMERMPTEMEFLINPRHAVSVKQLGVANYSNESVNMTGYTNEFSSSSSYSLSGEDRTGPISYQEPAPASKMKSVGIGKAGMSSFSKRGGNLSRPHSRSKW